MPLLWAIELLRLPASSSGALAAIAHLPPGRGTQVVSTWGVTLRRLRVASFLDMKQKWGREGGVEKVLCIHIGGGGGEGGR